MSKCTKKILLLTAIVISTKQNLAAKSEHERKGTKKLNTISSCHTTQG